MIKKLDQMLDVLKGSEKVVLSVAAAHDEEVLLAIKSATEMNIITPILVGQEDKIRKISDEINFDLNGIKIYLGLMILFSIILFAISFTILKFKNEL